MTNACICKGQIKKGKKTKLLSQKLMPGEIVLVAHKDLDETVAKDLLAKKVKAVINSYSFFSGNYPHKGPEVLLQKGVILLENAGEELFSQLNDNDWVVIKESYVLKDNKVIAKGEILNLEIFYCRYGLSEKKIEKKLNDFVNNTLKYAQMETGIILGHLSLPDIAIELKNKQVVIVIRGKNYREDFEAIIPYIKETRPALIGVDGGADLIIEKGFVPDMVIGDMDSVSNEALISAKEIIVHAYPDGYAPGKKRMQKLGLPCKCLPAPGTSEDIAFLLAYEKQAQLIVAVGSHSHMLDFLEKGRKGMGSTFLVRLKIGARFVDAKGVSMLYNNTLNWPSISLLVISALLPISVLILMSPMMQYFFKIVWLRLKMALL